MTGRRSPCPQAGHRGHDAAGRPRQRRQRGQQRGQALAAGVDDVRRAQHRVVARQQHGAQVGGDVLEIGEGGLHLGTGLAHEGAGLTDHAPGIARQQLALVHQHAGAARSAWAAVRRRASFRERRPLQEQGEDHDHRAACSARPARVPPLPDLCGGHLFSVRENRRLSIVRKPGRARVPYVREFSRPGPDKRASLAKICSAAKANGGGKAAGRLCRRRLDPEEALALADHGGDIVGLHAQVGTHERGAAVVVNMDDGWRILRHGVPVVSRAKVVGGCAHEAHYTAPCPAARGHARRGEKCNARVRTPTVSADFKTGPRPCGDDARRAI